MVEWLPSNATLAKERYGDCMKNKVEIVFEIQWVPESQTNERKELSLKGGAMI